MTAAQNPSTASRWIALYVLCTGMLMIVLDSTVVNVALPSIQDDLGFSNAGLAWVVNAYLITFGGLLLLAGRLGDLLGRRTMFLSGLAVFTAASLGCGLAHSQGVLVAARFVQGVGGAMTSAVILGMIVTMFSEPREQAKAIGVFAFVASAGGAVGLLVGGVVTESVDWHWIFFINVPIGLGTALAARRLIAPGRGIGFGSGPDVPGALLCTGALMLAVFTIVKPAAQDGWTAGPTLGLAAGTLLLFAAFVAREASARNPLMPLRILRSRNVIGSNLIQIVGAAGMFGIFFLGALYLQRVLGYGPLAIGLSFLPVCVLMGTLSIRYCDVLVGRFGARRTMIPGLMLIMLGLALFSRAPVGGSYVEYVLPPMVLMGLGAGICFPALMTLAMSAATPQDAGLTSGLINTTAQVGGALGLAVLATLAAGRTETLVAQGHSTAAALTGGYHLAFVVAAGLVACAVVIALAVLRPDAGPGARPEAPAAESDEVPGAEPARDPSYAEV